MITDKFVVGGIAALMLAVSGPAVRAADFLPVGRLFNGTDVTSEGTVQTGTHRGVPYTISADGSGMAGQWSLRCLQDTMTDHRYCSVSSGPLWVLVDAKGPINISVGSNHYPGSRVALRLDNGTPRTASADGFNRAESSTLLRSILRAKSVRTRHVEWPDRVHTDESVTTEGLQEALDVARWAISQR